MFRWVRIFWENLFNGLSGAAGSIYTDDPDTYTREQNERNDGFHYSWEEEDEADD